ncbi:nucleotide-binding protein [Pseudomonas chlororaphis]|uniref:nucleotide-binding protein n=1 Tax=Pseudomonas chlororaphis TaxID=587753 RepID=UPI00215A15A2|nr:nucleotide-binding protein [Pseudomonas chlororaphis]UVE43432.1 nucleotide-binding protein [Pseudomonas chlororaphis]
MNKPKIFIASSAESLNIAQAINSNLDYDFEMTLWTGGTFKLSSTALDDLIKKTSTVDFALFIFAPDDLAIIREREERIVRDNVVFEMGLFIGAIGKDRCFIVKPRNQELHLPTDLAGLIPTDYDSSRTDGDWVSATNKACYDIKQKVTEKGILNRLAVGKEQKIHANPPTYSISECDKAFLLACLSSETILPQGLDYRSIEREISGFPDAAIHLSAIRLDRMGLLSKSIETSDNYNDHDYYIYTITQSGLDLLLADGGLWAEKTSRTSKAHNNKTRLASDFDDDIPF